MLIRDEFFSSVSQLKGDLATAERLWDHVVNCYSEVHRHYHTLDHLEAMTHELTGFRSAVSSWTAMVFAIVWHDVKYNVRRNDNEDKSAVVAGEALTTLRAPADVRDRCIEMILATQGHAVSADPEVNLFTDADLAILGASPETYARYAANIRKEFSIYPDVLFRDGRAKVLKAFLSTNRIFKTQPFWEKYEENARRNIQWELKTL